jgi:hypothetical protein
VGIADDGGGRGQVRTSAMSLLPNTGWSRIKFCSSA